MVPKASAVPPPCWLCRAYFKASNILYYVSWFNSIYIPKRSIVLEFLFYIRKTEYLPQGGCKEFKVNMCYTEKDVFKCHLYIGKTFDRI